MYYSPRNIIRRLCCKHEWEWSRNIHGDEINAAGGKRSWWVCRKCGAAQLRSKLGGPEYEDES